MSTGGIFRLIANDGAQDKLLMASDLLRNRMHKISGFTGKRISGDVTNSDLTWDPYVDMISKTHVIFTNGSYKPFVACGFEYNKIIAAGNFDSTVKFALPQYGDFINDCVLHVKLTGLKGLTYTDRVRYVSLLGHRLITKASISINGTLLDEYTSDDYNAFYEFKVPPSKRIGWLRDIGQEIPFTAYLTADPSYDTIRQYLTYGDGNQTFKPSHESVELWIPMLFWFKSISESLPSRALKFGQNFISVTFAKTNELIAYSSIIDAAPNPQYPDGNYVAPKITECELYTNNIFLNPEIGDIFLKNYGFSLIRVHLRYTQQLNIPTDSIKLNTLKWPVECLYLAFKPSVNYKYSQYWQKNCILEPKEIQVPVVSQNFELVYTLSTTSAGLNTLVWNKVYDYTGAEVPSLPIDANNYIYWYLEISPDDKYYNMTDINYNIYYISDYNSVTKTFTVVTNWRVPISTSTKFKFFKPEIVVNVATYFKETPVIDLLSITAETIPIYAETSESFFNSYTSYRYGKDINTPQDRGWYMINFNFNPGDHQPSGHINVSRNREFYINYKADIANISPANPVNLIVLADAINFLIVSDQSATIHYAT
jgi:hypothetical protein